MSGIRQIYGKEIARIFRDKRMVFSVFFLPVVIMVVIMSIMNNLIAGMEDDIERHTPVVCISNEPESFGEFLKAADLQYEIKNISGEKEKRQAEADILNGAADLLIEFPETFQADIEGYADGDAIPQVKTYYNPSEDYSSAAYAEISEGTLEAYRQALLQERIGNLEQVTVFTVNTDNEDMIIQDEQKAGGKAIGMMLPYFITILLFAGAMGLGVDMIAGEKERGTMASLLVSPVKRSSIVLGKVFSLMTVSGLSSLIYIIVMVVCMPMMMESMTGTDGTGLDISLSAKQILMLGALLVVIAFLYSTIIALVSVFARTMKEASTYIMPVYMVVLVVGLLTMFASGKTAGYSYYIPLYNTALVLKGILAQEVTAAQYLIAFAETVLLGGALTGLIVKAFESEKVMSS